MLAVWLKALHIAALAIWGGGLLALPGLSAREFQKADAEAADPYGRLWTHRMSRFVYDTIVSPAAVLAIASGTALIFVTMPLDGWLFLKLAAVAGLVVTHMLVGRLIDQTEAPQFEATRPVALALLFSTIVFILLILWLVLQKPAVPDAVFPGWLLDHPEEVPLPLPDALPLPEPQRGSSGILMPT